MRNMYSQSTQVKFLRKPNMLPVLIASNPATDVKTIDANNVTNVNHSS